MSNIAVIILTKDEKLHIERCLEKLVPLEARQIFVVDCFSIDGTQRIVQEWKNDKIGQTYFIIVEHEWPGLQSVQFNWALDNLPIETKWILRLDADEYLTPASIEWLKENLNGIDEKVSALEFTLERKFMGGVIRHGTNGIPMVHYRWVRTDKGPMLVWAETKKSADYAEDKPVVDFEVFKSSGVLTAAIIGRDGRLVRQHWPLPGRTGVQGRPALMENGDWLLLQRGRSKGRLMVLKVK
jgi:glycosyltransferase involved in cell wall biosynthesis